MKHYKRSTAYHRKSGKKKFLLWAIAFAFVGCILLALAGVEPLATIKNNLVGKVNSFGCVSKTSLPVASKQLGSWRILLYGYNRNGESLTVKIGIVNESENPLKFGATGLSAPYVPILKDQYGVLFAPDYFDSLGGYTIFYKNKTIYPGDTLIGNLNYEVNRMSNDIEVWLGTDYVTGPRLDEYLFELK